MKNRSVPFFLRALLVGLAIAGLSACAGTRELVAPLTPGEPEPEIVLEGVDGALEDNVRAHLALTQEPCDAPLWRVRQRFARADQDIATGLRAFGYYHPRVEKDLEEIEGCWRAVFRIEPGEPVRVTAVDVRIRGEAGEDPAFRTLLEKLPVREGEQLNHGEYEKAKQAIANLAAERGYFDGRFTIGRLAVDPGQNRAQVDLEYDSGPRYRFGPIRLHQEVLRPALVERFVRIEPGEAYEGARLAALNAALIDSGYFSRVDIRPRVQEAEDTRVPVDVELTPRRRHRFSTGLGAATDTGLRASAGYGNRRLNRRGHRFSLGGEISFITVDLGAEYQIPLSDPRTEWLTLRTSFQAENSDTLDTEILQASVSRTQIRFGEWLETEYVEFSREDFEVGEDEDIVSLVTPGLSWARTEADDPGHPRRGWRARVEIQGTDQVLGSDTAFAQFRAAGKWIRALPWDGRVLLRGDFGATATEDFSRLPGSKRFYAGGDNSVRGFGYRDLGPEDEAGDVVGGRFLLVGSFEYEHPITERWAVAAFIDAGNALKNLKGLDLDDLETGAGGGIRWRSPIGSVRLYIASPITDPDRSVRVHFIMGPDL
ncbi:MAG: outer membrane protein assembly factor [Gammaproteobacteria bacterium]|nr:outer membrane protein assembly factor [Gammaproteobacteria bacterium]NIR85721.1 outer membrane protein assembly factor [Gammaproteobacteria bacterium]NIR90254.1 outer membrane protein assembly factor [Gammaproteobacteria bacterium]NIU06855.1 outer membrane protein assembly factor [Gammaproteobacteria bacterium]NIV53788.1 BamA/TamA family outer membrane protein [Gammaproteobacteria bacterium]